MRILVLGSNGMAGHVIALFLEKSGHDVTGFAKNNHMSYKCIIGDAFDTMRLSAIIKEREFDYIINCIGVLNKAVDNHLSNGIFINSFLPHYIADCIKDTRTKLIHISTDCVFSGKTGEYQENAFRDADSLYGRSKALGEVIDDRNLTIRTSMVGPELKENGVGLLHWFLRQQTEVNGYAGVIWTGVSTITLAKAIDEAMKQNITGVYHLVNNTPICKYNLLKLFNLYCNHSRLNIKKDIAFRENKSLVNTRTDFEFEVPSYEEMVEELDKWIQEHSSLYPHYRRG